MDRQNGRTGRAPVRRGPAFFGAAAPGTPAGRWSGLIYSQLLAFAFLAACLWWVLGEIALVLPNDRITASLSVQDSLGPVLTRQLLLFALALVACHVLLGLAAFAGARLTEAAFPGSPPAGRRWLVTGWFAMLVGLVMAANTSWYPASRFGDEESWLLRDVFGLRPVSLMLGAAGILLLFLVLRALHAARGRAQAGPALALGLASVLSIAVTAGLFQGRASAGAAAPAARTAEPHVVIIGVDSLRSDLTPARGSDALTPAIDAFLAPAARFTDATTPLARTFGSWVSILTGRHPVTTNARVNLMPRDLVHEEDTLADALRGHGYRTVYATDEVRFANFDGSYGFDQLVTPPVGAVDFLLGYGGDMPLVNLVAATSVGRWLFPSNHANRAAHANYQPGDFIARLDDEIAITGPTFLTVHLTLSHWPYNWAGLARPATPQEYRPAYRRAVQAVDAQFEALMKLLADKSVLDNAIVVLLSDHGEALGGENDSMLRKTGSSREVWDSLWGHGTSVLSPHQYTVVLALRAYGRARLPGAGATYGFPVSLEDVRPTLEELATSRAPDDVDGRSLLPALADPAGAAAFAARIRFTETDFNTPGTLAGRYETSGIIDEAAVFYELDPGSGWMQYKRARLPELLARKQRAALSRDALLAAIPDWGSGAISYLYTSRQDPLPRPLAHRPDPARDAEAARLWDALQARFPGELPSLPLSP